MASNIGPITFVSGTGNQTFAIGMTPTWFNIKFRGATIKPSEGYYYGSNQYSLSDDTSSSVAKLIRVKDLTTGNVVMEGTVSFSSSNAVFNLTTNTLSSQNALISFGN